jgi:hypothetical protein
MIVAVQTQREHYKIKGVRMADEDILRNKVLATLRSTPCLDIKFSFGAITIGGMYYSIMAGFVQAGVLKIAFGVSNPKYDAEFRDGSLVFKPLNVQPATYFDTADGQGQIVHECTHAIVAETQKGNMVDRLDDEYVAYLAEAVFSLNKNPKFKGAHLLGSMPSKVTQKNQEKGIFVVNPGDPEVVSAQQWLSRFYGVNVSQLMKGIPRPGSGLADQGVEDAVRKLLEQSEKP